MTVPETPPGGHPRRLETAELVAATAAMVLEHDPWTWFVTLTTAKPTLDEQLAKRYRQLVSRLEEPVLDETEPLRWVCAWEPQRRGAWHLHALWHASWLARTPYALVHALWRNRAPAPAAGSSGLLVDEAALGVDWLVTRGSRPRGDRRPRAGDWAWLSPIRSSAGAAAHYVAKYVGKGGMLDWSVPKARLEA